MPLPVPNLDDLRFQSQLVDEARRRIAAYCPEWTDYNLSDPGITLVELFAWMTEQTIYRLNRVPEKMHIKFLELLGTNLLPASSARVELIFRLSTPFPIGPEDDTVAVVSQGTEVATRETEEKPETIFTTDTRLLIRSPRLTQLRREKEFQKNYLTRLSVEPFIVFDETEPKQGDTFYLGFDETQDISGYILRLFFTCEPTQAVGVRREDPPLVWECSLGEGRWHEISPSTFYEEKDTTGGLNNPEGQLVFYLPLAMQPDQVNGRNSYWVRCRFEQRRPEQGIYSESPRVTGVEVYSLGAATRATHAVIVREEILGDSSGEPNQSFLTQSHPVLALRPGETVEVEEERLGEIVFVPWQQVDDFAHSTRYERHFTLDTASGEVRFGPAVRQRDGTVRQYGRIPEAGREIRFSQYRYGGGVEGNVPAGQIQVLKSAVPYIDRVQNMIAAVGGQDQETLDEAKFRAMRELRTQQRAVTAEDYENLTKSTSRSVARVKCNVPQYSRGRLSPGVIEILIVPAATDALKVGRLSGLRVDDSLAQMVQKQLDAYRLLSTTLYIREPDYLGVKVRAEIVPSEYSLPDEVVARVMDCLNHFLCPLPLAEAPGPYSDLLGADWAGWPFGRSLYVAEIMSLIQRVPGVKHVLEVQLCTRSVNPGDEEPAAGVRPQINDIPHTPVSGKMIELAADMLLCSLEHEIVFANLGGRL